MKHSRHNEKITTVIFYWCSNHRICGVYIITFQDIPSSACTRNVPDYSSIAVTKPPEDPLLGNRTKKVQDLVDVKSRTPGIESKSSCHCNVDR